MSHVVHGRIFTLVEALYYYGVNLPTAVCSSFSAFLSAA